MITFSINDRLYNNNNSWTFLQFCFLAHIENVPRFCYYEQLTVAGNCRMCLIEELKSIKPLVACTILPLNGNTFFTNSMKVKKSREAMLEFLLINHPLDCPICCQGGECDLQDLTEIVGSDKGRFFDDKRAVLDKNIGPIIKTSMNRCIHCTRCVRFSVEVLNLQQLGLLGRGMSVEIGTYLDKYLLNEFQGNLVDICPVGALTSKLRSFNTRP
jgi:NADH-quinone oxidoreductase subunit G